MVSDSFRTQASRFVTCFRFFFAACCAISFFAGCASIQPPPGGPEDKTPPKLIETSPAANALNVPTASQLHFLFSVPLDRASFQQAFAISPYMNGRIKYHWSGYDEVTVELPEHLRDSTTYIVSLARDLKSHRGNPLGMPEHLVFSTGSAIDTGILAGVLLPPFQIGVQIKPTDIFIFAYDENIRKMDTLDYAHTPPDLLTQPNDKGQFQLFAMRVGHTYRVFALQDVYRNKVFDRGVDAFGLPSLDAKMDSTVKSDFYVRMSVVVDTVQPQLQDAEAIDSFHVRALFSKAIDSTTIQSRFFTLTNDASHTQMPVTAIFRERPDKRPGSITLLTQSSLVSGTAYTVRVLRDSIRDLAGNILNDSAKQVIFTTQQKLGTLSHVQLNGVSVFDSLEGIAQIPKIEFDYSDAVEKVGIDSSIALADSSHRAIKLRYEWADDARLRVLPLDSLKPLAWYTLTYKTKYIRSPIVQISGEGKDTLIRIRFQTLDLRENGFVSGDIALADSLWKPRIGAIQPQIAVQLISASNSEIRTALLPPHQTHYEFDRVPKGGYRLRAFLSYNGTAIYDAGSLIPWRFSAPSGDYPTPIDIRPRWKSEHADFIVK